MAHEKDKTKHDKHKIQTKLTTKKHDKRKKWQTNKMTNKQ